MAHYDIIIFYNGHSEICDTAKTYSDAVKCINCLKEACGEGVEMTIEPVEEDDYLNNI